MIFCIFDFMLKVYSYHFEDILIFFVV